jgi:SagB-type dehydrogenase family enzyme
LNRQALRRRGVKFCRVPHILWYWRGQTLIACDYLRRVEVTCPPVLVDVLSAFDRGRSVQDLARLLPNLPRRLIRAAVARLVKVGLLRRFDLASPSKDVFNSWTTWAPEAAFFHFATKDVRYRKNSTLAVQSPAKFAPLKRYHTSKRVLLRPPNVAGVLPNVVLERRTWRRFKSELLSLENLSTLLGLTWGVQHWLHLPGCPPMALKTSPSGGACHSIEAYVLTLRVSGVNRGLYHYAPDDHALVEVKRGASEGQVARYLPVQPWYRAASALVIMTSVFDRARARYPYARAYRSILAEAGHLCQTFCLIATWLGLAPFCTMALADSIIEKDLKIDGISESVIYVAGVGGRPGDTDWAPWPEKSSPLPRISDPQWVRRLHSAERTNRS